jgi:hypothetical protein
MYENSIMKSIAIFLKRGGEKERVIVGEYDQRTLYAYMELSQ